MAFFVENVGTEVVEFPESEPEAFAAVAVAVAGLVALSLFRRRATKA
jgi:hypothetical protein